MRKITSVKRNFIYNASYQLLVIIIPLITTPYLARIIGPNGTGIYSYNASICSYFSMFILLGLQNYGSRTISAIKNSDLKVTETFWSIYLFQFFCGIIVLSLYLVYIELFSSNKIASSLFIMSLLGYMFDISWFISGLEEFKILTLRNTIVKLLTVIAIFLFVKTKNDVYKYILIYTFGNMISAFLLWSIIPRYIKKFYFDIKKIKEHIKPNLILFIPIVAISLYKIMDKIMLGYMVNTIEVGFYETTERILNVPMALINALGIVMLPRMSSIYNRDANNNDAGKYIEKSIRFVMFLSTAISIGIMSVAKEFVPVFFGDGYEACIHLFWVLFPSVIFMGFANVIRTQYLIPRKMDRSYIVSIFCGAVVNLVFNTIMIPKYMSVGAGVGTLLAEATVCVIQCVAVRKQLPIMLYISKSLKYCFAALIMFGINVWINLGSGINALIEKIMLGGIIYVLVLMLFWIGNSKKKGVKR